MNLWVFRNSQGSGSGQPRTDARYTYLEKEIFKKREKITPTPLTYGQEVEFLLQELFDYGRLRQGWGIPGLDLRQENMSWIENYILSSWKYWKNQENTSLALGRRRILLHMLKMSKHDMIYLPNIGEQVIDKQCFSIANISEEYQYEDRTAMPNTWEKDFGHIIQVDSIQTFLYSEKTLPRRLFGAPYRAAIVPVKETYKTYQMLYDFASSLR